uniref:Uncharacterized protein n=1 Tax=Molossus molossus TaxID=27622 RepID=A0A7J8CZ51_MOLMO|nr:hypothetical protein HJG59_009444 [Molossus molossus]
MVPRHPLSQPPVRPFRSHRNNHRVGSAWLLCHGNCSHFFCSQCSFLKGPPGPHSPLQRVLIVMTSGFGEVMTVCGEPVLAGLHPQRCPPSCARQPCASRGRPGGAQGRRGQGCRGVCRLGSPALKPGSLGLAVSVPCGRVCSAPLTLRCTLSP